MAKRSDYWTSPRKDGGWSVKRTRTNQVTSVCSTQAEAWKETRRLARGAGSEAFLKGKDGKISTRNTYVNDPFPSRG